MSFDPVQFCHNTLTAFEESQLLSPHIFGETGLGKKSRISSYSLHLTVISIKLLLQYAVDNLINLHLVNDVMRNQRID